MHEMNRSVFGLFKTDEQLTNAVINLERAGFRNEDISCLVSQNDGTRDLGHRRRHRGLEGIAIGSTTGVLLGAVAGWALAVITPKEAISLESPDVTMLMFACMGLFSIIGSLIGLAFGVSQYRYEVVRYQGLTSNGTILISVHADDEVWAQKAEELLLRSGAMDISIDGEWAKGVVEAKALRSYPRLSSMGQRRIRVT